MFTCFKCSKGFKYKQNLIRHEKKCGTSTTSTNSSNNDIMNQKNICVTCPECNQIFGKLENLRIHVAEEHDVHQEEEKIRFISKQDFEEWKKRIEKENLCYYKKRRSCKTKNEIMRSYFYCHRTGFFKSESKGIRRIKSQGTNKIDATCTSSLVVIENTNNVDVTFHKTHFGHGSNLGRCYLTPQERANLGCYLTPQERAMFAGKISDGVTFDKLLDQIRDDIENVCDPKAEGIDHKT